MAASNVRSFWCIRRELLNKGVHLLGHGICDHNPTIVDLLIIFEGIGYNRDIVNGRETGRREMLFSEELADCSNVVGDRTGADGNACDRFTLHQRGGIAG